MTRSQRHLALAAVSGAGFVGLAFAVQTDRVAGFDQAIRTGLHSHASPLVTQVAEKLTWLGSVGVLSAFWIIGAVVLCFMRRWSSAMLLIAVMTGALALENALKFGFHRARPPAFFGSEPLTYSFPSGHALFSLCFYASLAILVSRWTRSSAMKNGTWIGACLLVVVIGATRVYLGVHYPSDVLGGYLVALAWLNIVLLTDEELASRQPAA